jgi:hypothetical protein
MLLASALEAGYLNIMHVNRTGETGEGYEINRSKRLPNLICSQTHRESFAIISLQHEV